MNALKNSDPLIVGLGDIVDIVTGKLDSNFAEDGGTYPCFTCAPTPLKINNYAYDDEAILLAGNNANGIFHLNYFRGKFNVYQRTYVLTAKNPKELDLRYLYYSLQLLLNLMRNFSQGTSTKFLTMRILKDLEIALPPFEIQKAISKILFDLDSKIELNRRMNGTLEAVGAAVFRRWFVDFEFPDEEGKPYKSSGGKMVYNDELEKEIPKGWIVKKLGDFIKFVKGKKPKQVTESQEKGFSPQILIDTLDGGQPLFTHPENMVLVEESGILMVMDGASSGRIERGQHGVLGSTLAKIVVDELPMTHVYHLLKTIEKHIKQNTTGTSIPHTDKALIKNYLVVVPEDTQLMNKFEKISSCILAKISNNKAEIRTLTQIKDLLLPKLMSGKIRVPVTEGNVEVC